MEKEELKKTIKEVLREFLEENFEKWEYLQRKWLKEGLSTTALVFYANNYRGN